MFVSLVSEFVIYIIRVERLTPQLGVLTGPGSAKCQWLHTIRGHGDPIKRWYYCTRYQDEDESQGGISSTEVWEKERQFSPNDVPSKESSGLDRHETNQLVTRLTRLLGETIHAT